jgi:hypothetical protein
MSKVVSDFESLVFGAIASGVSDITAIYTPLKRRHRQALEPEIKRLGYRPAERKDLRRRGSTRSQKDTRTTWAGS